MGFDFSETKYPEIAYHFSQYFARIRLPTGERYYSDHMLIANQQVPAMYLYVIILTRHLKPMACAITL
jgi:hypothetical protein